MKWNFWVANLIEAFERLAFFGVRAVVPLYMVSPDTGLGLTFTEKGAIFMVWALIQCLLPMISGGYTESYGYRKSMYVAFIINIAGYCLMANTTGFWTMMAAGALVGTGTAIFKPPVQGSVAKSLNEGNSAMGFGLFYWMVNIGWFFAPMLGSALRGNDFNPTWNHVFYGAAIVTAINFIPATFLFREPEIKKADKDKSPVQVFVDTMLVLWQDRPMLRFLLVVSGFWFMFMQLWDLLPNFIDEWVDTRDVGSLVSSNGFLAEKFLMSDGAAKPELLINIDALTIIILVIPISFLLGKYRMIFALMAGMIVGLIGFVGAGMTQVGVYCALGIFVFAIGEIMCSPKFSEYIGMSAPPDKKALYMGYSNIPFAIGWALGNGVSGPLYDAFSSKVALGRRYLVENLGVPESFAMSEEALPAKLVERALEASLDGASTDKIQKVVGQVSTRLDEIDALKEAKEITPEAAAEMAQQAMAPLDALSTGIDSYHATSVLWTAYNPWVIWILLGIIGALSVAGMWWNYRASTKKTVA